MAKYDFSGWATKANLKCSDGRIIMPDAFKHMDGKIVPLVWNHQHNDVNEILGQAVLEHREGEGVYAYGTFNDTESGKTAKLLVQHGDVNALSIFANKLKQQATKVGTAVMHGDIRELSLVLAGANPGAFIENVVIAHGDELCECEDEAIVYTGEQITLHHSDDKEDKKEPEKKGEEQMADQTKKEEVKEESAKDTKDKTVKEVFDTLNEEQKTVVYAMIGQALEDAGVVDDEDDEKSKGGNNDMKHNVFEQDEMMEDDVLTHAEMAEILGDIKRFGSLKEAFLQHGIENIGELFPEVKTVGETPELLKRNDSWVGEVLNGVHRTPFARIKTMYADITADEARAKGYVKGNLKVEEVIKAFKRTTSPTTVYKKQKLDRDDVVDITEFDVVAFLRAEMRLMLEEELARAILIGDGREADDKDHINDECIRPIWKDSDVYTVKASVSVSSTATAEDKAKAFIKACVKSRKLYKGSGSPVMYMSEDILTDCLLIEDTNGRRIYETIEKLASALTVKKIVPVTVMDNVTRTVDGATHALAGIYVNLSDYNIGADKGGAINMFDDFDIDYNAQKYLIETRCSGALVKPSAAVAIEFVKSSAQG